MKDNLPTFAEIAEGRISEAGKRDRIITIKVTIDTAKMMVLREEDRDALVSRLISLYRDSSHPLCPECGDYGEEHADGCIFERLLSA